MSRLPLAEKLSIEPKGFPCHNFQESPESPPRRVTAVLVPFRFQAEEESVIVGWSCSRGEFCCSSCRYAKRREEAT